jgi:hypothetical protein
LNDGAENGSSSTTNPPVELACEMGDGGLDVDWESIDLVECMQYALVANIFSFRGYQP